MNRNKHCPYLKKSNIVRYANAVNAKGRKTIIINIMLTKIGGTDNL